MGILAAFPNPGGVFASVALVGLALVRPRVLCFELRV
jgi:hypothetical protein